jgi:prophage regulatory protein
MSHAQQRPDRFEQWRILTIKEVCEILRYSRVHIYRLERAGKFISRVQIGAGRVGYYEHEFDVWLKNRQRGLNAEQQPKEIKKKKEPVQ